MFILNIVSISKPIEFKKVIFKLTFSIISFLLNQIELFIKKAADIAAFPKSK